jgi:hypothetical protein
MEFDIAQGQVWTYRSRLGESTSTLTVLQIEKALNTTAIVHISIDNLKVRKSVESRSEFWSISHIPIDKDVLVPSLINLHSYREVDIESNEGYLLWKEEYDKGKAGVWSLDVREIIGMSEPERPSW